MGKSSTTNFKKYIIPLNIIIIIGLFCVSKYLDLKIDETKVVEGVINSNCCGGVEAGVHYQETDRKPPDYIRRCFKSTRDNTELVYDWSGFPCTSADSDKCCTNIDGSDLGDCIPTTGGGYCSGDRNTMFRRGDSTAANYIRRSDDSILDINNTVDMEDYFFDRSATQMRKKLSPDMLAFLNRRDKNNKYIQSHIVERNRDKIKQKTEAKLKAAEQKKLIQIKDTILAVHLVFVLGFAFIIKDLIIKDIDYYYSIMSERYREFAGKTINTSAPVNTPLPVNTVTP